MLTPSLREVLHPLSDAHFAEAAAATRAVGGRTVIDSSFSSTGASFSRFFSHARQFAAEADVIVFSHPWVYPLIADMLDRSRQLLVYDSQNVEGKLRMRLLDDGSQGTQIVREVVRLESTLCREAAFDLCLFG